MKKTEAKQLIKEAYKWFPEDSAGRVILGSFEVDEYNNEAFATPIPFSKFANQDAWTLDKDAGSVTARIRHIQESMDTREFPLRTSVYLSHEKGYCFLILGTEQVDLIRRKKAAGGLANVTLNFEGVEKPAPNTCPIFRAGDLVDVSASSPLKGWLHLFSVNADRVITPVYPGEGKQSDILLSQNTRCNITDKINSAIRQKTKHVEAPPLRYCGNATGPERIVVMVVGSEDPLPVTIAHLRSRFPLPFLFAHEQRHRGMGYSLTDSDHDFSALLLEKIAIGTLDYYYEG